MTDTCRNGFKDLWKIAEHPQQALEHLAPFSHPSTKGEKQEHLVHVLERSSWGPLMKDYRDAFERRMAALAGFMGGFEGGKTKCQRVSIKGRLAMGLGNASVMENGLALNHTYGLPMLSGSGLKGMASAMAHLGLENESWRMRTPEKDFQGQGEDHRALFGDRDTGKEGAAAGMVVFHDAWWEPDANAAQLPFELDVLTPHQGKYNLNGGAWPNDWTDPVPSPFLTVRGTFVVPLTGPEAWVEAAFEILQMAFQHLGFGAKTQIGYGRGGELSEYTLPVKPQEKTDHEAHLFRIAKNAGYQPDQLGSYEVHAEGGAIHLMVSRRQVEKLLPNPSSGQKNRMNDKGLRVVCTYMPGEPGPRSMELP